MSTPIRAAELAASLTRALPHVSKDTELDALNAVRIEASGGYLFTIATDRYTFAINRVETIDNGPWAAHLRRDDVPVVVAWLERLNPGAVIELSTEVINDDTVIVLQSLVGSMRVPDKTSHRQHFPDWRKLARDIIQREPADPGFTGFNSRYLARFKGIGPMLHAWQDGPRSPLVLANEDGDFIGFVMPVHNEKKTRDGVAEKWAGPLRRTDAVVMGARFDLTATYEDRHGDPWQYAGRDGKYGEPLMDLVGIADDPWLLSKVIAEFGPLNQSDA
ncbi:phiSA1p31-related protein [Kitasatospora sp. A2-31]|uniref:phiSA1p31-related protein n=1 Tax=Kitasatospora sp. A2-31 TaxID=2916414 RepID=UPI001EE961A4|nr:phiSA1p31-related protein [Kitasatospora sp. A2-31]MCG6493394.1 phiSA1p31-related protein [Kitasatospora sp. A2-31]